MRKRTEGSGLLEKNPLYMLSEKDELHTTINKKLSRSIIRLYVATLCVLLAGTFCALSLSWRITLDGIESNLVRTANFSNFLIETALINSSKTLTTTRGKLELALSKKDFSHASIHQILAESVKASNLYKEPDGLGVLIFADSDGIVFARSDENLSEVIDVSDRFYFRDLRNSPAKKNTVGPMVNARTTDEWAFHMAQPIINERGQFLGVIAQQLNNQSISKELIKYADINNDSEIITGLPNQPASFKFPKWSLNESYLENDRFLTGVAVSPVMGLVSEVALPKSDFKKYFFAKNISVIIFSLAGWALITAFFLYLYKLTKKLIRAEIFSMRDVLTGLYNRRSLDDRLPVYMKASARSQTPLSVLFIDIDHFRVFNERFGHEVGDKALQAVASALAEVCQRPSDFICRWGGEEFVAVLPSTNLSGAEKIANDMLQAVRRLRLEISDGRTAQITISIGATTETLSVYSINCDLIEQADIAMRMAKAQGRNRCISYSSPIVNKEHKDHSVISSA